MLSPYRINPNNTNKRTKKFSNTKFDNNSHGDPDVKRPEMTSNDLKRPQTTSNEKNISPKKTNCRVDPCIVMLKLTINI